MSFRMLTTLLILQMLLPISTHATSMSTAEATPSLSPAHEQDTALAREIAAFGRAKVSVGESILAVEKHLSGARVVDVSFDGTPDQPIYHVKAVHRGKVWTGDVTASSGELVGLRPSMSVATLEPGERLNIADLGRTGFGLSDIVAIAEKSASAKALSAGLDRTSGQLKILVVVVSDGSLLQVAIDPGVKKSRRNQSSPVSYSGGRAAAH